LFKAMARQMARLAGYSRIIGLKMQFCTVKVR